MTNLIISVCIGCATLEFLDFLKHRIVRRKVLKAIKDLGIEDELAHLNCGIDARHFKLITERFYTRMTALDLLCVISELRQKGKLKPMEE